MRRIVRNLSTEAGRAFWADAEASAAKMADWPAWKRAGINVAQFRSEPVPRLPVRLDLEIVSWNRVRLVVRRGIEVLAELGEWTPLRGWDLTAAGCAAARLRRVLPLVEARAVERWRGSWEA